MSKMMVVVFDNEEKAYEGSRALAELHREGSISVYAAAVMARDASGKASVKDDISEGPIGTTLGMMTGAMIGVFGGPAGVALGAAAGGLMGSTADLINLGVGTDFLDDVAAQLQPGKVAVVAEVGETWVTPVDSRMEELGGTVYRRYRADVEDDQIDRDIAATQQEWNDLKAEFKVIVQEDKAKLQAKMDTAKAKLKKSGDRAKAKLDAMEKERQAKMKAIKEQISTAKAEAKEKLEHRSAEIKSDYEARSNKLKQAWELSKEALT